MESEKFEEREEKSVPKLPAPNSKSYSLKEILLLVLIVIGVVAFGLLAMNQFISWRYKNIFLQTPCQLCEELNPHLKDCFEDVSIIYTDEETGVEIENITDWKNKNNKDYDFDINDIKIIPS